MKIPKRIAILGAGPSGLVSAEEALQNDLIPTIFESKSGIGGVWSSSTCGGSVWNKMHTNISKFTTTFGDSPWASDVQMFPSAAEMLNYLNEYADRWNLRQYIRFQSKVVRVSPCTRESEVEMGSNGYHVHWIENDGPLTAKSETFDGVIVTSGIFSEGYIPEVPGLTTFSGRVIHSKKYNAGEAFNGLRVLTVGGSFSGAEIASDVSNYSSVSHHCFRDPFWILGRYLPSSNNNKNDSRNLPLDLIFYTRSFYQQLTTPTTAVEASNYTKNKFMASVCEQQQLHPELAIDAELFSRPYNVTVSDQYLSQVEQKRLIPKRQAISSIESGSTVHFHNGHSIDVDAIIFCTGYSPELDFLDESIRQKISYDPNDRLQPVILFNECCHPDVKNLFFVGMYKGPYFAVMEQQARFSARVLSGRVPLPPSTVMFDGLQGELAIRNAEPPRPQFPHPEYVRFADEIAKCAKSFPDLQKFADNTFTLSNAFEPLKDDAVHLESMKAEIYERFMSEPVTPSHYNLVQDLIKVIQQMDTVQEVIRKF